VCFCLTVFKLVQGSFQNFHLQTELATGITFTKVKAKVKNFERLRYNYVVVFVDNNYAVVAVLTLCNFVFLPL